MKNRPSFEEIHMRMALLLRERSTCARLQVGCVIASADFRKILAMGYNGNATGLPNECDSVEPGKCGCFVSGTRVFPRGVTRAYRRWYEGEVVHVVTSAGDFTATPNHPILAFGRGWAPAQSLHKGDHLLGTVRDKKVLGRAPYYEHGIPIEDVFKTLSVSFGAVRRTGTSHDFHGDGVVDEGIDVVTADRGLGSYSKTSVGENFAEPSLAATFVVPTTLCGTCSVSQLVAAISDEPGLNQAVPNDDDAHIVASGERYGGFPFQVGGNDLFCGQIDHGLALVPSEVFGDLSKSPCSTETILDSRMRHAEGRRNVDHLFSVAVALHDVLHVERYRWSGHVYNLETRNHWYSLQAGGIIAHNCLHSEENAVINCDSPRHWKKIVFCTHLPCKMCAKRLVNLGGVQKVYYSEDYRLKEGLSVFAAADIDFERLQVSHEQ